MICPGCGCAMRRESRDKSYSYKGEVMMVPGVDGWHCPECGEIVFASPEEGALYDAAIREHIVKVNRRLFPDLRTIRKKLHLTQAEAGRLFGGGVTAFSRYESGKTEPPVALVKLFKVLDRHPELLVEVK
ncbi:MAG: hypothetical protein A2511_10140 [Deltaproteobacteria bacterium RIFOXYD12_FULL_50_9]|nr:MAG: hypothetical protein A2511_10140 [Deltaproteobacteria bacterium RIFOXYD12_FULL_50_9]